MTMRKRDYLAACAVAALLARTCCCWSDGEELLPPPLPPLALAREPSAPPPAPWPFVEPLRDLADEPAPRVAVVAQAAVLPPTSPETLLVCGDARSIGLLAEVRHDYATRAAIVCCSESIGVALAKVADGTADGAICCSVTPPELPPGLVCRSLGTFIAALTTSPQNPVHDVPRVQLSALLSGQIRAWRELGGADDDLRLVWSQRRPYRALKLRSNADERMPRFRDDAGLLGWISTDAQCLGVVQLSALAGQRVSVLTIDGVPPSRHAFEAGEYPLGYRVFLIHAARPRLRLEAFLHYLAGTRGHQLLRRQLDP